MPPFLRVSGVGGKGLREPGPAAERPVMPGACALRAASALPEGNLVEELEGQGKARTKIPGEGEKRKAAGKGGGGRSLAPARKTPGQCAVGRASSPGRRDMTEAQAREKPQRCSEGAALGKARRKRGETRGAAGERAWKSRGNTTHGRPRRRYVPAGRKLSAACGCFRCGRRIRAWRDTCFCRPR